LALVDHVAGEFAALVGYGAARAVRALRGRKRRRVQKSQLREWRKPVEAPGPEDHRSFIGELSYGGGGVNLVNVHLFVETMPFGGTGSAGLGHYYGKYGFDALTHAKSMLISPPDVAIEHLYSPFTDAKNQALKGWFEY
jgi:hypothetical protein